MIEKPLTLEFYGPQQKNQSRFHTECRTCKKAYMKNYQENKRLSKDPEARRIKEVYKTKEITKEERQQKIKNAYAYIYYQAFGRSISEKQLKEIEGIEE